MKGKMSGTPTGEELKQLSMDLVFEHAAPVWKIEAAKAVEATAKALPFFTSDDVWERIPSWAKTHEPRALGPIMAKAAKDGIIEKANMPGMNSKRRSRHAAPLSIWLSKTFKRKPDGK